jgi:hypothetical protein
MIAIAKVLAGIAGGFVFLAGVGSINPAAHCAALAAAPAELSSCASAVDDGDIKRITENSAGSKLLNLQVFEVTNAQDRGMANGKRQCSATMWANIGKMRIDFTVEWIGAVGGQIWIQTTAIEPAN